MSRTERRHGVWTLEDRARNVLQYLDVDVTHGTAALEVALDHDRSRGVLDLGCFAPSGFRGWSGGARSRFVVGERGATPGYLPGPLEPGVWRVALRLHRIPADGLGWDATITVHDSPPPVPADPPGRRPLAERPPARSLPSVDGRRWRPGDLHAHTVHSDGALTIDELAEVAAGRGLEFLAVTDHNTVSHHPLLAAAGARAGIDLLPGQEVTTDRGHANAFGDVGWLDFREPAAQWLAAVTARGGLLSVNHPLSGDCAWLHEMPRRPPLAEVWHSSWFDRRWGAPLAWWQVWSPPGSWVTAIGGSDFHRSGSDALPGSPTTWIAGADGEPVLTGLAAGRVAVNAGVSDPLLLRVGDEFRALDAEGTLLVDTSGRYRVVRSADAAFPASAGPHWLVDPEQRVLALAN